MNLYHVFKPVRESLSLLMAAVLLIVSSSFALAGPAKPLGDLTVRGKLNVKVNGEPAETGRTIFAGSTVSTGEDSGAVVNIAGKGRIELGANSTFTVTDETDASVGQVVAGSAKLLEGIGELSVKNAEGTAIAVRKGDMVSATAGKTSGRDQRDKDGKCIDTNNDGKLDCYEGLPLWGWVLIAAGVGAAVILGVALADNEGSSSITPVR